MEDNDKEYIFRWGLPLTDLYDVALKFYKEKGGSAIQFSYDEKLHLIAYTRQVVHGKYKEDALPPLGVLDVIGRDRRLAWQALGDMSSRDAMAAFIHLIDKRCLHFNAFVQAQKVELDDQKQKKEQNEIGKMQSKIKTSLPNDFQEKLSIDSSHDKHEEDTRRRIQEALNAQTYQQFKSYAEQQFPENTDQQIILMRQLQDQHYHQYMLQLQQQQNQLNTRQTLVATSTQHETPLVDTNYDNENDSHSNDGAKIILEGDDVKCMMNPDSILRVINDGNGNSDTDDSDDDGGDSAIIHPASMWTRKDIQEFKNQVRNEGTDTVMKVGHGETVTVRVPTCDGGSCLFWEFATDSYDIGFGVYFEWEKPLTKEVSVHISETEDEDSDDLVDDEQDQNETDVERARLSASKDSQQHSSGNKPPLDVIVPIYRRDCHEEPCASEWESLLTKLLRKNEEKLLKVMKQNVELELELVETFESNKNSVISTKYE